MDKIQKGLLLILMLFLYQYFTECEEIIFAVFNDCHISNYGSLHIVNKAIAKINNDENIQFVIILGDISYDGTLDQIKLAKSCFDKLNVPYYPIPGNHDINENYIEIFGYPNYVIDKSDLRIILFNSNPGTNPFNIYLLNWIEYNINITNKSIIICCHDPLTPGMSEVYRHPYADDVIELFDDKIITCLAGHYHTNTENIDNNIFYYTTICLSSTRTNHDENPLKGYRIFVFDTITKQLTNQIYAE